jgi:hypothetical protein
MDFELYSNSICYNLDIGKFWSNNNKGVQGPVSYMNEE